MLRLVQSTVRRRPPSQALKFELKSPDFRQHARLFSASVSRRNHETPTRNIGIIAHIDAGKTTTTERMLYYSGFTRRIGDVDDGSTVTDFLPAERARGITIQSAAISFNWPPLPESSQPARPSFPQTPRSLIAHNVNLIDTPGHADFTFEVLRSLRILDGAICILDGVAGVEAQTEKVWTQANKYKIPRIIFVNKLDREGSSFSNTVRAVGAKLAGWPAVCQIPWRDGKESVFCGVGDVINLRAMKWDSSDGKVVRIFDLSELQQHSPALGDQIKEARVALVELLSEHDDQMVECFLEHEEDHLAIPASEIVACLRRCILKGDGHIIPIFAGASFRNIGVQPLLDAVNDLLPEPEERPDPEVAIGTEKTKLSTLMSGKFVPATVTAVTSSGKKARKQQSQTAVSQSMLRAIEGCALAFKVVNDPKKGVLVYVRVYAGTLNANSLLFNTNLQVAERSQRLLKMYAADATDMPTIQAGQIGVITGLRSARTGDTLISYKGMNPKSGPPQPLNQLQLRPIDVPPAVFFASVEPNSLGEEPHLKECLAILLREDPSLHVFTDEETGQTLLSGMGELHLEIARDRLINDFKAKARIGKIEVGYRETITEACGAHAIVDKAISGKKVKAGCEVNITPIETSDLGEDSLTQTLINGNSLQVIIDADAEVEQDMAFLKTTDEVALTEALLSGVSAALARGPCLSFPLHGVCAAITIKPDRDYFSTADSTLAAFSAAAHLATRNALKSIETRIMEPVMNVTITVDEESMGKVTQDISSARGGQVTQLDNDSDVLAAAEERRVIDVSKIWVPSDPFLAATGVNEHSQRIMRTIQARVPLKEMVGYLKHLRSMTGGKGTFVMSVDRFELMNQRREKATIDELRGW